MTIAERIQLHRLGYTKEEIADLAAAGYDPAGLEEPQQPEPEQPEPEQPAQLEQPAQPEYLTEIRTALEKLTAAIQGANIQQARQPPAPDPDADLAKVFDSIYK